MKWEVVEIKIDSIRTGYVLRNGESYYHNPNDSIPIFSRDVAESKRDEMNRVKFKDVESGKHFVIEGKFSTFIKIPTFYLYGYEYNTVQYERPRPEVTKFLYILDEQAVNVIDTYYAKSDRE